MIICEVNKNHLNVRTRELLTAGSQNVNTVEFRFNEAWDGLAKTATFKTSKKTISVLLNTNTTAIPWEALADAGEILAVGVFGVSGETLVLPTVWGILGKVMDAAHLGDDEKEPTPGVYQKILDELNSLEKPTWESVQNKPFSTLGSGLEVEDGALSVTGGGATAKNAVLYTEQTLTEEQQAQARENIGAIGSPQSATVGDVLTVEEVDENGKPTKWKTAPAAAEQVQADIAEDDESSPAYIRNNPFTPVMRYEERPHTETYNNISAYYYYFNKGNIGDEKFMLEVDDKKIYSIEPSFEAFKEAFIAAGLTWIGNTKERIYFTAPDSSTSIKFGAQCTRLDGYSLPPHTSQKAGAFQVDEMNATDSESNYDRCVYKYYSSLTYPMTYPMLYAPKSIKTYDKFDISATNYSSKGHMAYYLAEGTASTQLGLTENDYPVMTYCTDSYYGSAAKNMFFYIETATGRRFKTKKDEYNNTSWDTFEEISTSSGGSSVFYINITSSTDSDGNTTYSADKTADEIVAAYNSGALMVVIVDGSDMIPFVQHNYTKYSTRTLHYFIFTSSNASKEISLQLQISVYTTGAESALDIMVFNYAPIIVFYVIGTDDNLIASCDSNALEGLPQSRAIIMGQNNHILNATQVNRTDSGFEVIAVDHENSKLIKITVDDSTTPTGGMYQYTYSEESLPTGSTYTLPVATADALGGIKADAATDEDTQDVRITANGKLMAKAGGGGKTWELAGSQDVAEDVLSVSIPVTSARDYLVQISLQNSSQTSGQRALQVSFNKNNNTKAVTQSSNIFNSSGSRSIFVKFSRVDGRIMWRVYHNLNGGGIVDENVDNMANFNAGAFTSPSDIQNITISNHNSIAGYYIGAGSKIRVYTRGV